MYNIDEKMIFDIPFKISRENIKIRVIYANGSVGNGSCLTIIAFFLSTRFSSHGFVTSFQNGISSIPEIIGIFIDVEHYLDNNI